MNARERYISIYKHNLNLKWLGKRPKRKLSRPYIVFRCNFRYCRSKKCKITNNVLLL